MRTELRVCCGSAHCKIDFDDVKKLLLKQS